MQIHAIEECAVIVRMSPGDALLLADACRIAGYNTDTEEEHPKKLIFDLAAGHLEALALIAQAQGLVVNNTEFLAEWTLDEVREHWDIAGAGKGESK